MRVMVLVKATEDSEKGTLPTAEAFEAMGRYNDELLNAFFCATPTALSPLRRPSTPRSPLASSGTLKAPLYI